LAAPPAATPPPPSNFIIIIIIIFDVMRKLEMGLAFWKNGCIALPSFEPCPYTWEGEIFHSSWSFKISFFSKKFAKIRVH
jgi:hypothetical protein